MTHNSETVPFLADNQHSRGDEEHQSDVGRSTYNSDSDVEGADPSSIEYYSFTDKLKDIPRRLYVALRSFAKPRERIILTILTTFIILLSISIPIFIYLKKYYIPRKIEEIVYTKEARPHIESLHLHPIKEYGMPIKVSALLELEYKSPVTSWLEPTTFNISLIDKLQAKDCIISYDVVNQPYQFLSNIKSTIRHGDEKVSDSELFSLVKVSTLHAVQIPHSQIMIPFKQQVLVKPQCLPNITQIIDNRRDSYDIQIDTVLPIRMMFGLFNVEYTKRVSIDLNSGDGHGNNDSFIDFNFVNTTIYGFFNVSSYFDVRFNEIKNPNDNKTIEIISDITQDLYLTASYKGNDFLHLIVREPLNISTEVGKSNILKVESFTRNSLELQYLQKLMLDYNENKQITITAHDFAFADSINAVFDDNGKLKLDNQIKWIESYLNGFDVTFDVPYVNFSMSDQNVMNVFSEKIIQGIFNSRL